MMLDSVGADEHFGYLYKDAPFNLTTIFVNQCYERGEHFQYFAGEMSGLNLQCFSTKKRQCFGTESKSDLQVHWLLILLGKSGPGFYAMKVLGSF